MNKDLAREILLLCRPGTPDESEPEVIEALRFAETDLDLTAWFKSQQAVTATIRAKLKTAPVPEGLKEQILSERRSLTPLKWQTPRRVSVLSMAAALFLLFALLSLFYFRQPGGNGLASFRDRMVRIALREYPRMDIETSDPGRIRAFLARENAYGDYVLPAALEKAAATGCAVLKPWRGKKVSMLCFSSGQPRDPTQKNDLFLFIVDQAAVPGAPPFDSAKSVRVNAASAVSWSQGGKTYVLVGDGDEQFLKKFY